MESLIVGSWNHRNIKTHFYISMVKLTKRFLDSDYREIKNFFSC